MEGYGVEKQNMYKSKAKKSSHRMSTKYELKQDRRAMQITEEEKKEFKPVEHMTIFQSTLVDTVDGKSLPEIVDVLMPNGSVILCCKVKTKSYPIDGHLLCYYNENYIELSEWGITFKIPLEKNEVKIRKSKDINIQ